MRVSGSLIALIRFAAAAVIGSFIMLVGLGVYWLDSRPDLSVWHIAELDEEYTRQSPVTDFADYLRLEERLFRQLDERVYAAVPVAFNSQINRYTRASRADPGRSGVNWNRSFELRQETPEVAVLLLHGLSDSPYSVRALAESLHAQGATVLGLRIPGHGTAPSALVDIEWQDMAAAVRLAVRHLRAAGAERPLYIVGYSNGGALAIEYALAQLTDETLPAVQGIVLLSPEIGVSPAAALAVWQGRMGRLLGLDKLAWNGLAPEYDPYKYNSFPVNAGDLAYRITQHIQKQIGALQKTGSLTEMPPVLAFQSSVDATVTGAALIAHLFDRLPSAGNELVMFDINRIAELGGLLKQDPRAVFGPLLSTAERGYDLTVVTNKSDSSRGVVARTRAHDGSVAVVDIDDEWPADVYSLSHVALPFPPDDPVYGRGPYLPGDGLRLGNLALRGERGVLQISGNQLLRLRWNPFFGYVERRTLEFTGVVAEASQQ